MSDKLYNLIMHSNPKFWSENNGYIDFPKERFLEYTKEHLKKQFQSLDQSAISKIIALPTLFAIEGERTDTRIGRITKVEELQRGIRIYYKFNEEYYPLSNGVLYKNRNELNIEDFEFYRGHWAIKEGDIPIFYENYKKSLTGIAHQLKNADKKVQLIYAFNGMGKTRLSRELKDLIAPKNDDDEVETTQPKVIYYNAFTEDLFYWDNDLTGDTERKLKIQPNAYTHWVLQEQGQDRNAIAHFQSYTSDKLTPRFNEEYKIKDADGKEIIVPAFSEVTFSFERGNEEKSDNVKISKGEESNFIWSIFYSLIEQVISTLNIPEVSDRDTDRYNQLEYVFIDDPVSSLDENHLIELAVNLAGLIKESNSKLKFIITTHSPLFYNVLYGQLGVKSGYILSKSDEDNYDLEEKKGDSNTAFAYHLHIKNLIEQAIEQKNVQRYHFTLLRNLYEKTSGFFGYKEWADLLNTAEGDKKSYIALMNSFTHSKVSNEEIAELQPPQKQTLKLLLDNLINNYGTWAQKEVQNG